MRACNTILASHAAHAHHRNVPLTIVLCFIMAFALHFQIYKIFSYHVINLQTILPTDNLRDSGWANCCRSNRENRVIQGRNYVQLGDCKHRSKKSQTSLGI